MRNLTLRNSNLLFVDVVVNDGDRFVALRIFFIASHVCVTPPFALAMLIGLLHFESFNGITCARESNAGLNSSTHDDASTF